MKFELLAMDAGMLLLIYAAIAILGLAIFYYIIKAAVKAGTFEALQDHARISAPMPKAIDDRPANAAQSELQKRYEKGEISFEEYQQEWEKLS